MNATGSRESIVLKVTISQPSKHLVKMVLVYGGEEPCCISPCGLLDTPGFKPIVWSFAIETQLLIALRADFGLAMNQVKALSDGENEIRAYSFRRLTSTEQET